MESQLFPEAFLAEVDWRGPESFVAVIDRYLDETTQFNGLPNSRAFPYGIETIALLGVMAQEKGVKFVPPVPKGNSGDDADAIRKFLDATRKEFAAQVSNLSLEALHGHFRKHITRQFAYEFSQGDLDRIQQITNELRSLLQKTPDLDQRYRERLLKRLERFQSELHKKMSSLDRFWGLIGEAGVVIGKFGKDAKPIVDRIRELGQIFWRTQARAEDLPSGTELPWTLQQQDSLELRAGDES